MARKPKDNKPSFSLINLHAAGIDIGASSHFVAVPADLEGETVREFQCFTADLHRLAAWLKGHGITTVAMESTGIYWLPLYEILEAQGFEVNLVNARHISTVPGRKSDVLDCQWIQRLHSHGLLQGAFQPAQEITPLRAYTRHRANWVQYAGIHIQHMQKALRLMNLNLDAVVSDITGTTGTQIINAILAGERDPAALARLRDSRCQKTEQAISQALDGHYRAEHLFALKQAKHLYDFYQQQIADCDQQIESGLKTLNQQTAHGRADAVPPKPAKPKKPGKKAPGFDLRTELY